ncbi:MAG: hypothetical protein H7Z74_03105 [Anaerolineae bacterium]|nr:hypothetical protein [Gemmatimonadaceae bacterium]
MPSSGQSDAFPATSVRRELGLTKAVIVILGIGLVFVGRREAAWPIATWAMYSKRTTAFPPARASIIELKVISVQGDTHAVSSIDLFPAERVEVADILFLHAFDDTPPKHRDSDRSYLVRLLNLRMSDVEIQEIQGWRVSWDVSPLELPPLRRDRPAEVRLLGSFSAAHYGQRGRR